MKHTQTETLIHEGACIHYQWKPGRPATGTAGELALESFVEAIKLDNPGRE